MHEFSWLSFLGAALGQGTVYCEAFPFLGARHLLPLSSLFLPNNGRDLNCSEHFGSQLDVLEMFLHNIFSMLLTAIQTLKRLLLMLCDEIHLRSWWCLVCRVSALWNRTHLSRNRSAAGIRYSAALRAGVFMGTIKVQVPRPICVVVPPTALELSKWGREGERERERQSVYI